MLKYNINNEKRKVVCILTIVKKVNNKVFYTKSFTGIATCAPEDTFDENYGKNIAHIRAMIKFKEWEKKYYTKVVKELNRLSIAYMQKINEFRKRLQKSSKNSQRLQNELSEILKRS